MPARVRRFVIVFSFLSASCLAQGGSAVITLVMPPPGGDGYESMQAGGAFAEGAASLYYNPALLAELERSTGSQVFFTTSRQDLLPPLGIPDLYSRFWGVSAVFPDKAGYDLGVGYFKNHTSFGYNEVTDPEGSLLGRGRSYEDVHALGCALRLGGPAALGVTAKYFDSHLAPGLADDATGWALDFGLVLNPLLAPLVLRSVVISPSVGAAVTNVGPDVFYVEALQADPIPTTFSLAVGLRMDFFDAALVEGNMSKDDEIHRRSWSRHNPVYNRGFSVLLLGYRHSRAWLRDESGKRKERHESHSLELNFLRLHRFRQRLTRGDFRSSPQAMESGYAFLRTNVLGVPFRANPRIAWGRREIHSMDGGIREGQYAYFLNFSL